MRRGSQLFDQLTGLPWAPTGYTLTGPDGTRYELDARGKVVGIEFVDGTGHTTEWIVSDAGIAAVTGDAADRLDFIRDSQGRIVRSAHRTPARPTPTPKASS